MKEMERTRVAVPRLLAGLEGKRKDVEEVVEAGEFGFAVTRRSS